MLDLDIYGEIELRLFKNSSAGIGQLINQLGKHNNVRIVRSIAPLLPAVAETKNTAVKR
jgi:hypothetical protein